MRTLLREFFGPGRLSSGRVCAGLVTAYVLVPGAWLGKWAWERVAPLLESQGHQVLPLTLPGLADRASELTPSTGLLAHVADVTGALRRHDLREVVLVGHSYAGAVVGAVARRIPERIGAQVYLDTMPLEEGACLLDTFDPAGRTRFERTLTQERGTRVWPMPQPLGGIAPAEGLTEEDLDLLRRRGTPHPALAYEERLAGPVAQARPPPSVGISCVEDEAAAKAEGPQFLREHPGWRYYSLPICHWPMLSAPRELASILTSITVG
jgi:pimeloyl-ACP methyl ester carboxylesterase